jgi:putative membrane protein
MSKFIVAALLAGGMAVSSLPAFAQNASKQDKTFLTKAIQGNLAEIDMGKLAQDKGQSQQTKDFGGMLVNDHTDANNKAMDIARQLNVDAPQQPSKKQTADHDKLAKLNGARFDREFAMHMVADHKKDIADYKKQAKMKGDDPTAGYANDTLPVLQKHLETAQSLVKSEKSASK